ncbi:MAG: trigger factor [Chloroflexi bacterium]|nr:trigger factor [Chloroflexota bacterium]
MKVTAESLPESQVLLQIELEEPEVERHRERAYRKLVQRVNIPGFRKGKTPRGILERYLGPEALLQEDLEDLLARSALEAVRQQNLDAVSRPEVTEVQSLAPVSFKVTVPLRPKVELGDYASLRVPWEPSQVTPEQEVEVMETIRRQTTPWEPVERAVQVGDLLTLDIRGMVEEPAEGEAPSGEAREQVFIDQKGLNYLLQEGAAYPMPGFSEPLVGMEKGQTKEFALQAPEEFAVRDMAGKPCRFTVTVHEVKEQRLPEIDDEWAKGVLDGHDSLEALRAKVRADLQEQADARAHRDYEEKVLDALTAQATVGFPPVLVESEIDHLLGDEDERLRGLGGTLAAHMASAGRDLASVREGVRPQARQRVLRALLVSQLMEAEKIAVSPEEMDAEVERLVTGQPEGEGRDNARQLFATEGARDTLRRRLLAQKAVDRLTALARGEGPSASPEAPREEAVQPG